MKIAVCCKITPDSEDVKPQADGTVDLAKANWGVSDYDLNAIEAAANLGCETVAITAGGPMIGGTRLQKALMSHGDMSSLVRIIDEDLVDADARLQALTLAAAIKKTGADLVLCGEGSSDRYQRITASQVAAELGWPCLNCVDRIDVDGDRLVVERDLEDGVQEVEIDLPCVLAVTSTINVPPTPSMKAVLAAGRKPVEELSLADLDVRPVECIVRTSVRVPERPGRSRVILEGTPEETVSQLVKKLTDDMVL